MNFCKVRGRRGKLARRVRGRRAMRRCYSELVDEQCKISDQGLTPMHQSSIISQTSQTLNMSNDMFQRSIEPCEGGLGSVCMASETNVPLEIVGYV